MVTSSTTEQDGWVLLRAETTIPAGTTIVQVGVDYKATVDGNGDYYGGAAYIDHVVIGTVE